MEKWEQFEEKRKELKKKYKSFRKKRIMLCVIYNILADILIFTFLKGKLFPYSIPAFIASTALSVIFMFRAINELLKIEAEQEKLLLDEAPIGKIKI